MSSGGVLDLTYGYDAAGNVTGITDTRQGQCATYGYDVLNRLKTATGPRTLSYVHDPVGNGVSSALNGSLTSYSCSATTNRLVSSTNGQQYEGFFHDNDGRLT